MNLISKFRAINWGVVALTFFLPFSRGCNNEVRYLSVEAFQDSRYFLIRGLPVLYPILILIAGVILHKLSETNRIKLLRLLYCVWAVLMSLFTFWMMDVLFLDAVRPVMFGYLSVLILLWGLMMFGWVRAKDSVGYQGRLAFSMTAVSAWFFPMIVFIDKGWLIGAKLFVLATTLILLSYLTESVSARMNRKAAS